MACTTAARWPLRAPVRCFTSSNSCKDSWDPKQYLAHKETFQGQFAADYLTLPSESGATLAARLGRASRLLDLGSGDGSHTRRMAEFLPTGASATGLDLSPSMVAAAQASQISNVASKKVPVDFVAGNIATWGKEAANCGQFDLATSFMALHWVSEADLPATLSGLRAALAHARAGTSGSTSDNRSWFVASFHGDNSMQSLVDAVNTTVDATQLSTGGGGSKNTSAEASVDASSPALSSWGQAGAAVAAARWREHFRHGRASWRPITMLPAAQWRQLLHDAGFNVDDGVVKIRYVAVVAFFALFQYLGNYAFVGIQCTDNPKKISRGRESFSFYCFSSFTFCSFF